jgi:hypothetical protein
MKRSKKTYVVMSASIFIVAMLLSSAIAVPIKNNEAVENPLIKRVQDKLNENEMLKEKIQTKYPKLYDAITSGKFLNYPIFCLATIPIVIWVFLANIEYPAFVLAVVSFWCVICIEGYEPGV